MKKITVKKDEKVSKFIVFNNIEAENNIVTAQCVDGSSVSFSLLEDRIITIEPYEDPRDWLLVAGVCSEEIYAESKHRYDDESQIKLKENLTQKEAEELETIIREKMNNY